MHYIVLDLEFNQDFTSLQDISKKSSGYPFEIIQIGAFKLDGEMNTVATLNRYVKPTVYKEISPFITELTGITTEQLQKEETFPEVYKAFTQFIDGTDSIFCIWGTSDIKELFRNAENHQLNNELLPRRFINLQPYISTHFGFPPNKLLGLQTAVEAFQLPITFPFHNSIYDAYYTAELLKKIGCSSLQPNVYNPSYVVITPRQPKREIDTDLLLKQFEKMYAREMTDEEQKIILLAYKMGKTGQFLK